MSFKKRTKGKVVCDNRELKEHIEDWCQSEGQNFDMIAEVLEKTGFTMPVKLSNFNTCCTPVAFQCNDASGKEAGISLIWGDFTEISPGFIVRTEENNFKSVTLYDVSFENSAESQDFFTPVMSLTGKCIFVGNLKISSHYGWEICVFDVEVDGHSRMQLTIHKLDEDYDGPLDRTWCNKYCDEMLEYLSKFDFNNFDADELGKNTTKIMHIEDTELYKILVKYDEAQRTEMCG